MWFRKADESSLGDAFRLLRDDGDLVFDSRHELLLSNPSASKAPSPIADRPALRSVLA
jgi:hypothetical protein